MGAQESRSGNSYFLFDGEIIAQVDDRFFDHNASDAIATATGRGEAIFFSTEEGDFVLRHYRRGGLPAKFLDDRYLGISLASSRAWREWHLLDELYRGGLPVPQPIAARVVKGGLLYRADLVTRRLNAQPLADLLFGESISDEMWGQLGETISNFHKRGIYHADLNARNIMIASNGGFYLIDFDRGERREPARSWQNANLDRLRRSLDKFRRNNHHFNFSELNWSQLLDGYQAS
ncbi:MAG: 3-deoxy-D-manno-octulosonic acid kinase [Gammaproteobacteria bacterium]|nr:3-deoxy-D-manno-octulosonic acid kinase [Gammaproteobacteria bacterium]